MPLTSFLKSLSDEFLKRSPIRVVGEDYAGSNTFTFFDQADFHGIVWMDPNGAMPPLPPPAAPKTGSLNAFKCMVLNGGLNTALDFNLLNPQRDILLSAAATNVADAVFQVMQDPLIQIRSNTSADIGSALSNFYDGSPPPVLLLGIQSLVNLKRTDPLSYQNNYKVGSRLLTNHILDSLFPIFSPRALRKDAVVFDWNASLVLACPEFRLDQNRLTFHFKVGIQDKSRVVYMK